MVTINLVILGPAGSGKSTLTANFGKWIQKELGFKVSYVNLDPGAEYLPYRPDYDIRSLVTVKEVMKREKLGPNGAIIRCMDIMMENIDKVVKKISGLKSDYRLIDTPGQMEPFTFRRIGPELVSKLSDLGSVISLFLVDSVLASSVTGLIVVELMGLVVQLRLLAPTLIILNKADLLRVSFDIEKLLTDPEYLTKALNKDIKEGLINDLMLFLGEAILQYFQASRLIKISAKKCKGFEALYDLIHETFCTCGDLT